MLRKVFREELAKFYVSFELYSTRFAKYAEKNYRDGLAKLKGAPNSIREIDLAKFFEGEIAKFYVSFELHPARFV